MTDRELLEMAAKAVGHDISHPWNAYRMTLDTPVAALVVRTKHGFMKTGWNPLEDKGEALNLLCELSMQIVENNGGALREVIFKIGDNDHAMEIDWPHTPAVTRRAITRAAAEIGRQIK